MMHKNEKSLSSKHHNKENIKNNVKKVFKNDQVTVLWRQALQFPDIYKYRENKKKTGWKLYQPFVAAAALTDALQSSIHAWVLRCLAHVLAEVYLSLAQAAALNHEPSATPRITDNRYL